MMSHHQLSRAPMTESDCEDSVSSVSSLKTVDAEIAEYISTRLSKNPETENVLEWWKFNTEHVVFCVFLHLVRHQKGHCVGASWKRDAQACDPSQSAIFSSSIAI